MGKTFIKLCSIAISSIIFLTGCLAHPDDIDTDIKYEEGTANGSIETDANGRPIDWGGDYQGTYIPPEETVENGVYLPPPHIPGYNDPPATVGDDWVDNPDNVVVTTTQPDKFTPKSYEQITKMSDKELLDYYGGEETNCYVAGDGSFFYHKTGEVGWPRAQGWDVAFADIEAKYGKCDISLPTFGTGSENMAFYWFEGNTVYGLLMYQYKLFDTQSALCSIKEDLLSYDTMEEALEKHDRLLGTCFKVYGKTYHATRFLYIWKTPDGYTVYDRIGNNIYFMEG